jgi:hypothetical protein
MEFKFTDWSIWNQSPQFKVMSKTERKSEKISILELQKRIPKECFEKNLITSTYYFLRDLFFLYLCYMVYPYCNNILLKFIWWNITGFFMWVKSFFLKKSVCLSLVMIVVTLIFPNTL